MQNTVWLVGAGLMAKEYAKVLKALDSPFLVIGRTEENCKRMADEFGCESIPGGINNYLETKPTIPARAIVAVGIEALSETTSLLLNYGVKDILLEKPGVAHPSEIDALSELAREKKASVLLAYNRRYYASVIKAKEIIKNDGGAASFIFEFTEWSNIISGLKKHPAEHNNWFLGNSTHVIDTAFYLGGKPKELATFVKGSLDWHPNSSIFAGAGITESDALFSYSANWEGPGRWSIEIITNKNRLIFRPMEKLQLQKLNSVTIEPVELNDDLDLKFKPGLFLQTKAFINSDYENFCNIFEQQMNIDQFYLRMGNYKKTQAFR